MPSIPDEFLTYFTTLREEVTAIEEGNNEGLKFEIWFKENIMKTYYELSDEDIFHAGFPNGNELKLDIGARKSDGTYLIIQAKWSESQNGSDGYSNFAVNDIEDCTAALKHIEDTPDNGNETRTDFIKLLMEEHGDNWKDHVQLIFVCNGILAKSEPIKNLINNNKIEIFSIAELENIQTEGTVAESKPLDVRDWTFRKNVGFGIVNTKDLADFVTAKKGGVEYKNQALFNENLRFQLPNSKKLLEIKQRMEETLENSPEDFLAMNNGILVLGTKVHGMEEGFRVNDKSRKEQDLIKRRTILLNEFEDIEYTLQGMNDDDDEVDEFNRKLEKLAKEKEEINELIEETRRSIKGIIFSQPSIANGGQTTSAMYDNYIMGDMENIGEVFVKFVCAPQGDEGLEFRHKIAVASNKQNPINERDEISNRKEQRAIKKFWESLDNRILYDHKTGLSKAVKENADQKRKFKFDLTPASENLQGIREITNSDYGLIMLSTIGGIPHICAGGQQNANLFTVGHDNYNMAFDEPSEYRLRLAVFGSFITRISNIMKTIGGAKYNNYMKPHITHAETLASETEKEDYLVPKRERWQKHMGFLNYWNYSLIYLCFQTLERIAEKYHGKEGTILKDATTAEQAFSILLDLILSEQVDIEFHKKNMWLDKCWYKTEKRFTEEYFGGKMMLVDDDDLTLLKEGPGPCSDILPSLFSLIRRIEIVHRSHYSLQWSEKGKAFQKKTLLDLCSNSLEPLCNSKGEIKDKLGIDIMLPEDGEDNNLQEGGIQTDEFNNKISIIHAMSNGGHPEKAEQRLTALIEKLIENDQFVGDYKEQCEDMYLIITGNEFDNESQ